LQDVAAQSSRTAGMSPDLLINHNVYVIGYTVLISLQRGVPGLG
jgi:hypothetical protein